MSEIEYFECMCHSDEHRLVFHLELDDIWNVPKNKDKPIKDYWAPEVYATFHLRSHSFWKRLWCGVKYILGISSKFGHFDDFMLRPEDAARLKGVCEAYLKRTDEYWAALEAQEGAKADVVAGSVG